jgi:hypothetical protein
MSFRREALAAAGAFREDLGRRGADPLGCEETELAIRVLRTHPGGTILYVPTARVEHFVPPERATWRYFRRRCFGEGRSKALVADRVGPADALAVEARYATRTLPAGVLRGLRDAACGQPAGLGRAAAIVAGLAVTAAGFALGTAERRRGDSP